MSTFVRSVATTSADNGHIQANFGNIRTRALHTETVDCSATLAATTVVASTLTRRNGDSFTVDVQKDGVDVGSFSTLNFSSPEVTTTDSGSGIATITLEGITVEENGTSVGTVRTLNFTTASPSLSVADSGGGKATITQTDTLATVLAANNDAGALDILNVTNLEFSSTSKGVQIGTTGSPAYTTSSDAVAIGSGSSAVAGCTVIGKNASSDSANSVVIGYNANATSTAASSVVCGNAATCASVGGVCIGSNASVGAAATNGIAIGYNASSVGAFSIAIGAKATATGDYSVAIGYYSTTPSAHGIAIGYRAQAGENGIALGKFAVAGANEMEINVSGALAAGSSGSFRTKFLTSASPATAPTSGAGTAVPANPDVWLEISIGNTTYLSPQWAGTL